MYKITRDKILNIFNSLETAMVSGNDHAKVWIIYSKYKLTTADIAIATNKGYTVVQS